MTTITAEPTHPVATTPAEDPRRRGFIGQLGVDTAYVLLGFPLSIVTFVLIITGLSLGAGLLVTLLGIPVLVATVFVARGFAEVERVRIPSVLRRPRIRVRYKATPSGTGIWRRFFTPLSDVQSWLDVAHAVLRFPISVAGFTIVVSWFATALGGLTMWAWDWSIPYGPDYHYGLPELLGFGSGATSRVVFYAIVGLLMAIALPFVVRACALLEALLAQGMLTGIATLRDQVADLTVGQATAQGQTAAAVAAEATALRRLERDIHDGPQQRLVRLSVDLGRAKEQLDADPNAARATVDEALTQAREALAELRALSRGIAPPILTDRGLAAALAGLAARATVPVELALGPLDVATAAGPARLTALAEQTAYFTVAEALTNVAKHSGATRCLITAGHDGSQLIVTISDDGVGGAQVAKGHGLSGLADRLHAAGGQLWISSPPDGPTVIKAEVPCPPPN